MIKKPIAIVTGGAGFIGSHMVDFLLKKKFKVIVVDSFVGGHKKNLKHNIKNKDLVIKKIDICKIKNNNIVFRNADYVFHFAGLGDLIPSIEKPEKYMNTNVQGTINILEASRYANVKKFIYAASSSCYGIYNHRTNEKIRTSPEHPYALSKYLGEQAVLHWFKVYKLPVISIRIFNAYGPRVRTTGVYGAVFGVFFKQKLKNKPLTVIGDGKQLRDFIYVTDVVNAFYKAAISKKIGKIYNLGSDNPQSINKLAKLIGGKISYIPDRPGEPKKTWANIEKINKDLSWKPIVKFEDGVKKMLEHIDDWKNAPLWSAKRIKLVTKDWYKHLSK